MLATVILVSLAIGVGIFSLSVYVNFHEVPENLDYKTKTKYCDEERKCAGEDSTGYCAHWLLGTVACHITSQ